MEVGLVEVHIHDTIHKCTHKFAITIARIIPTKVRNVESQLIKLYIRALVHHTKCL